MGLPSIIVTFKTLAASAIKRSQKGTLLVILRDTNAVGKTGLTSVTQIPDSLSTSNQEYLERAFVGYQTPPKRVIVYTLSASEDINDALDFAATQDFDYLVPPPDVTAEEATTIATWISSQRNTEDMTYKAILPNKAADNEGVVNFVASNIRVGTTTYTAAQYLSRIGGIIVGTPMAISCTYAPLAEVNDIDRLTKADADDAVDAGKLILIHDGEKVKIGRGVNSFVTTVQNKGDIFKKIKIVEAMDMIKKDIKGTLQDDYIGKYANSYDNRCILLTAIKAYFEGLEMDDILAKGKSSIEIDIDAVENYIKSKGIDTSEMTEQELREYDTDDKVFLTASITILDAIEEVRIPIHV